MSRPMLFSVLALLGIVASALPVQAAGPVVVGPVKCKYAAVITYDYDCDGQVDTGLSPLYATPSQCQTGLITLIQNAQYHGFCWWTPGVNCLAAPAGCYESLPADEYPSPRD